MEKPKSFVDSTPNFGRTGHNQLALADGLFSPDEGTASADAGGGLPRGSVHSFQTHFSQMIIAAEESQGVLSSKSDNAFQKQSSSNVTSKRDKERAKPLAFSDKGHSTKRSSVATKIQRPARQGAETTATQPNASNTATARAASKAELSNNSPRVAPGSDETCLLLQLLRKEVAAKELEILGLRAMYEEQVLELRRFKLQSSAEVEVLKQRMLALERLFGSTDQQSGLGREFGDRGHSNEPPFEATVSLESPRLSAVPPGLQSKEELQPASLPQHQALQRLQTKGLDTTESHLFHPASYLQRSMNSQVGYCPRLEPPLRSSFGSKAHAVPRLVHPLRASHPARSYSAVGGPPPSSAPISVSVALGLANERSRSSSCGPVLSTSVSQPVLQSLRPSSTVLHTVTTGSSLVLPMRDPQANIIVQHDQRAKFFVLGTQGVHTPRQARCL